MDKTMLITGIEEIMAELADEIQHAHGFSTGYNACKEAKNELVELVDRFMDEAKLEGIADQTEREWKDDR